MLGRIKALYHLLSAIVAVWRFGFPSRKITVIGITGTDGKTTTTTLIYEILKAAGYKTSMITSVHAVVAGKTYDTGFHVTCPDAYYIQKYLREAVNHGDTHFVLEVTSHGLSQHRVFGVRFAVGVLTNITHEHLDWHKTFAHYVATKLSLLQKSRVAVLPRDEAEIYNKALPLLRNQKMITYGIRRDATVTPTTYPIKTKLPGEFNRYNCLAAAAAAHTLGVKKKYILQAIARFAGVKGRMDVITQKPFRVIVDFAHTPNAIEQVLKTVRSQTKGALIHVFGSASERDVTKRPFMGAASSHYADVIVLTEEDYRKESVESIMDQIASGIALGKPVYRYPNRKEALTFALSIAKPGDTVIATGKGHEQSLCRGTTEYPWDERKVLEQAIKKLSTRKHAHS